MSNATRNQIVLTSSLKAANWREDYESVEIFRAGKLALSLLQGRAGSPSMRAGFRRSYMRARRLARQG